MTPAKDRIDRLWHEALREIATRGLAIFPSAVTSDAPMALWPPDRDLAEFLDLATTLGKRMVYAESTSLSPADLLDAVALALGRALEELGADSPEEAFRELGITSEPQVRDLLTFAGPHYGQRRNVSVEWTHEGVVHRFMRYAAWHSELMARATLVADVLEARGANIR